MRALRLLLGLAVLVQAIILKDTLLGIAGLLFSGMAIFNKSFCGPAGCAVPVKRRSKITAETTYEEVV